MKKKNTSSRLGKKASPALAKNESLEKRRARARAILAELHRLYPEAECALTHASALQLLISTILSAQCTDERVNKVTPKLFSRYPDARAMSFARQTDVEEIIRSTGFFRNKARSIIGAGKIITEKFGGLVPDTMENLLEVPGVARKTANVVLGTWFKKNVGVVVDTHIGRLSHRLRLTWRSRDEKDAVRIEQDLIELIPREEWTFLGHALIWHGRKICSARKPACDQCTLSQYCPSAFTFDRNSGKKVPTRHAQRRS